MICRIITKLAASAPVMAVRTQCFVPKRKTPKTAA